MSLRLRQWAGSGPACHPTRSRRVVNPADLRTRSRPGDRALGLPHPARTASSPAMRHQRIGRTLGRARRRRERGVQRPRLAHLGARGTAPLMARGGAARRRLRRPQRQRPDLVRTPGRRPPHLSRTASCRDAPPDRVRDPRGAVQMVAQAGPAALDRAWPLSRAPPPVGAEPRPPGQSGWSGAVERSTPVAASRSEARASNHTSRPTRRDHIAGVTSGEVTEAAVPARFGRAVFQSAVSARVCGRRGLVLPPAIVPANRGATPGAVSP